jgi:hypothetical protein
MGQQLLLEQVSLTRGEQGVPAIPARTSSRCTMIVVCTHGYRSMHHPSLVIGSAVLLLLPPLLLLLLLLARQACNSMASTCLTLAS